MKLLAVCIAVSFFSVVKAQAMPFPKAVLPAQQTEAVDHDHDHAEHLGADHTHEDETVVMTEEDTVDCQMPQEFRDAGQKYADCYNCMFPPEWLREVKDQVEPLDPTMTSEAHAENFVQLVKSQKTSMPNAVTGKMIYPIVGGAKFLSGLGEPRSGGRRHQGVDLGAPMGAPIVAVWPGRVTKVGSGGLGGWSVRIDHPNGMTTYYAHMKNKPMVSDDELISAGQKLGLVGMSGNARGTLPHLHFEVRSGRKVMNPVAYIGGGRTRSAKELEADSDLDYRVDSGKPSADDNVAEVPSRSNDDKGVAGLRFPINPTAPRRLRSNDNDENKAVASAPRNKRNNKGREVIDLDQNLMSSRPAEGLPGVSIPYMATRK